VVRNEKDSRGDSIAERYGPPVTVSDVEDLLYREHIPAGTIYKVMQAVRQAVSWNRHSAARPWAGDLEDGLTRQEERRAAERRSRLAEALRTEGRQRAAAETVNLPSVNSPAEKLNEGTSGRLGYCGGQRGPGGPGSPPHSHTAARSGGRRRNHPPGGARGSQAPLRASERDTGGGAAIHG